MARRNRTLMAIALCTAVLVAAPLFAQTAPPAQPAAKAKFITPLRGDADLQVIVEPPVVKGTTITTTIKVKNVNTMPIAGLKVEEFWFNKAGQPTAGGDTKRLAKPLMPGEIGTFTLVDEKDASMYSSKYQFGHTYGKIRVKNVKRF